MWMGGHEHSYSVKGISLVTETLTALVPRRCNQMWLIPNMRCKRDSVVALEPLKHQSVVSSSCPFRTPYTLVCSYGGRCHLRVGHDFSNKQKDD